MATTATTGQSTRANGHVGWLIGLVALSILLNYIDRGIIGIAAPLMKGELGLSATGFGLAVSAFFWMYAPANLLIGWLSDRFCVYRVFAAGVAVWALATFLTGFIGGIASLIALRLMLGLGEAIAFPGSSKIFAAEVPSRHRGVANAAVGAALSFGPAVGTLAGGTILALHGWRPIFWAFGAVTILWLIPWTAVSKPFRGVTVRSAVVAPVALSRLVRMPALWAMSAAHFMSNYGFYFLLAWLPLYLIDSRHYPLAEMTGMATAGLVAQGIAALAVGKLSDLMVARGADEGRLRRWSMAVGQLLAGAAVAGIYLAETPGMVLFWLVTTGIASGVVAVNLFAVGQMFGGPRASGGWIGVQNAVGNTSGIVGPIVTGLIVDASGNYGWAFAIAAGVAALGFVWWLFVIPPIREIDATN
jgi:MFS family permease